MKRTTPRTLFIASTVFIFAALPTTAKEYYVGEPIVQNDMQIVPHYLLGIEMAPMPKGAAMVPMQFILKLTCTRRRTKSMALRRTSGFPT